MSESNAVGPARAPVVNRLFFVAAARAEAPLPVQIWRLWGGMGVALLFIFAISCVAVWSALVPARAGELPIVRTAGEGFYDATSLRGDAAQDVRAYLDRSWVECDTLAGHGRCNLNASTESVQLIHVDDAALASINYDNDTGNVPAVRLTLWKRRSDGRYDLLASTDDAPWIGAMVAIRKDTTTIRVSGLCRVRPTGAAARRGGRPSTWATATAN